MATYTTLKYGSKGDEVKKLQTALGFTGKDVDGIFGDKTLSAVKNYQKNNGLTVDGIVGENTWGALNKNSTTPTTAPTTPQQNSTYKYEDFKYDPYEKSDVVKEAEAMVQQQMSQKPGNFQYSWQSQLDDIYNKIMNREEFSYDLNGDALYQQYKDQYTTQGQMAMMDTMGQAAAMTGGYGNSYAQGVGQQAYQGYLQQLNDKVPELYQLALDQYNQEEQGLYNQAALLGQQKEQEYGMHRDSVSDYYTALDYLTGRADKLAADEYAQWGDKIGMDYNIHSDRQTAGYQEKQDANTLALNMLGMGLVPDAEKLAMAGISSTEAQAIINKVKEQEKLAATVSSGGSSNEDTGTKLWKSTGTYDDYGNPIFIDNNGKTQAYGQGINPYTGTTHKDTKTNGEYDSNKVFSNGYQPNNINGTKLKDSGMSTNVTGKNQTIWEANGKYWLWRGDLNKYVEVDISDLD